VRAGAPLKTGPAGEVTQQAPQHPKTYRYYYAWSDLEGTQPGLALSPGLLLALGFLAYERFGVSVQAKRVLGWLEPALALACGYWIYLRTFLRELWIGGYLAFLGFSCCSWPRGFTSRHS